MALLRVLRVQRVWGDWGLVVWDSDSRDQTFEYVAANGSKEPTLANAAKRTKVCYLEKD